MWISSILMFPLIFTFSTLIGIYLYNNLEMNHTNLISIKYGKNNFSYKDFIHNTTRCWYLLLLTMLFFFNLFPVHIYSNSFIYFNSWRIGLISFSLFLTVFISYLLRTNLNKFNILLYNEFFLILLLFIPIIYPLFLGCTNLLLLYILLEIIAILLLSLLYTSSILNFSGSNNKVNTYNNRHVFFLLFYQFIFNFYSSLIFALFLILFITKFGVIDYNSVAPRLYVMWFYNMNINTTPYFYTSSYLPLFFIIFFLLKFGVGPWFAFKVQLYQHLQPAILFIYIVIYFIYLLPYGLFLIYSIFWLPYISTFTLTSWFVISLILVFLYTSNISTFSSILSLSSVLFYLFLITQMLII